MAKPVIKIRFQNGLTFHDFKRSVFDVEGLSDLFDFEDAADPDFIVFGPYGNDVPPAGRHIRIGYYCENIKPDMTVCDWAFGVPHESEVNHPRYKRILWHGINATQLIKVPVYHVKGVNNQSKFCNYLYSKNVNYREAFFKALSSYKNVDAPGLSMNNMDSVDKLYQGDTWECKRQFLSNYKFTIAFENYLYPGYQTEKLYDAMVAGSIPIYMGDPFVGEIFNTASFINARDYVKLKNNRLVRWLERISQPDFTDIRPSFFNTPWHMVKRKIKTWGREAKMRLQVNNIDFKPLIGRIMELGTDHTKYLHMQQQPWLVNNRLPANASLKSRWIEIFETNNG